MQCFLCNDGGGDFEGGGSEDDEAARRVVGRGLTSETCREVSPSRIYNIETKNNAMSEETESIVHDE